MKSIISEDYSFIEFWFVSQILINISSLLVCYSINSQIQILSKN